MKKSTAVPLLLLGSTALLAGCSPDRSPQHRNQETRQDRYATIEACDRDWVDDVCERSNSGVGSSSVYVGPRYFYSHDNGTPYVIDRNGRTRPMPSHYGAYNNYSAGTAGAPAMASDRTTVVTRNATSSSRASSIFRGGFGSGRSSGSSGG